MYKWGTWIVSCNYLTGRAARRILIQHLQISSLKEANQKQLNLSLYERQEYDCQDLQIALHFMGISSWESRQNVWSLIPIKGQYSAMLSWWLNCNHRIVFNDTILKPWLSSQFGHRGHDVRAGYQFNLHTSRGPELVASRAQKPTANNTI